MFTVRAFRCCVAATIIGCTVQCTASFAITIMAEWGPVQLAPGGPRVGPGFSVEVRISTKENWATLAEEGFDITYAAPDCMRVYALAEEVEWLWAKGFDFRIVRWPTARPPERTMLSRGLGVYHWHDTLTQDLEDYAAAHPDICRLHSLGKSANGMQLWAMLITDNPDVEEDEPEFKYVGTIHGNEPEGMELCLYFIDKLLTGYGTDQRVTALVDTTAIWVVPLMNPDGREFDSRGNWYGCDLNRYFPAYWGPHGGGWPYPTPQLEKGNVFLKGEPDTTGFQVEVAHIVGWTVAHSFVASGALHSGAVLVCYPYGDAEGATDGHYWGDSPTPDDLLIEEISLDYATAHGQPMGIINGAAWFVARGEMGDWNYRYVSNNDITIEVCDFGLPEGQLPALWAAHEEAMMGLVESVHRGIHGLVTDSVTGLPVYAQVYVEGNAQPVYTDPGVGDYHRMLLPGTYDMVFDAVGYRPHKVDGVNVTQQTPSVRVDVTLEALPVAHWWRFDEGTGLTARDSAGPTGGTLTGACQWVDGQVRGALEFNGSDSFVELPALPVLATDDVKISAWICPESGSLSGHAPIVAQFYRTGTSSPYNYFGYDLCLDNGRLAMYVGNTPATSNITLTAGRWYHVIGTYDGTTIEVFIDGQSVGTTAASGLSGVSTQSAYVGHSYSDTSDPNSESFFEGAIDEVQVCSSIECFPSCHDDYSEWLNVGRPACWCFETQCHGDSDGETEGAAKSGLYRVHYNDLNTLLAAWNVAEPPHGRGIASVVGPRGDLGICTDFDHDVEGSAKTGLFRVHFNDLNMLIANWSTVEPPLGPGIATDCLDCGRGDSMIGSEQVDFERMMAFLEGLWLDEEALKGVDQDALLRVMEAVAEAVEEF